MTSYLYFCSQCVYVPHPFYIPSALNSHLFHLFYFVPALVSSSFAIFFPLSRSSSFHLLAWIVLCRVFSTLFAFEHHFRSAEAVAGAIAAFCFTNEYLSASYIRLWFQKHPKIVCNAIQPILLAFFSSFFASAHCTPFKLYRTKHEKDFNIHFTFVFDIFPFPCEIFSLFLFCY